MVDGATASTWNCGSTITSGRSSVGILQGCLRQDGAPSHTARNTPTYLRRENVTFIEPHRWPPNSPDLNPVDCTVWGALQQIVYQRRRFTTINQLKQAIVTEWDKLLQRFIDRAIGQWRRRLEGRPTARRTNWTFNVKTTASELL